MDLWMIKNERCPVCAGIAVCDKKGIKHCGFSCDEVREFACGYVLGHKVAKHAVEVLKPCPYAEEQKKKKAIKNGESVRLVNFIRSLNMDDESIEEIIDSLPCDVREARRT